MDSENEGKSKAVVKSQIPGPKRCPDAVFNNPLLMDKIMEFCLHKSDAEDISVKDVLGLRLVNKAWLQSVPRFLKTSNKSFVNLSCKNGEIFFGGARRKITGYDYISVFSNTFRPEYSILPLKLELDPSFFTEEKYNILEYMFQNCGDIMSTLCVHYSQPSDSINLKFGQLNLPILKNLTFKFGVPSIEGEDRIQPLCLENKILVWEFLQELLSSAPTLENFTLAQLDNYQILESKSGFLQLPESLTKMDLEGSLTIKEFELLSKNRLKNLKTINLVVDDYKPEEQLVSKILARFQHQVKNFSVKMVAPTGAPGSIQFPGVMKNLRSFSVSRHTFEVRPGKRQCFSELAPNLTELSIDEVTEQDFFEWIRGPSFVNVRTLETCLDTLAPGGVGQRDELVNERILNYIKTSFPNVQELTLQFHFDRSPLEYLINNFGTIKKLLFDFNIKGSEIISMTVYFVETLRRP